MLQPMMLAAITQASATSLCRQVIFNLSVLQMKMIFSFT